MVQRRRNVVSLAVENITKQETEDPGLTKRDLLTRLWSGLGIVALFEFLGVGAVFLRPRKPRVKIGGFGELIVAGGIDQFQPDTVTAFRKGQFYLARLEDGGFLALSRKCTHLGCTVLWAPEENRFKCPCHASIFDITGNVVAPPAPRPLDVYPLSIENSIVKVNTGKPARRRQFERSQVKYS